MVDMLRRTLRYYTETFNNYTGISSSSMSHIPLPAVCKTASFPPHLPTYLRRVYRYQHMDFEYAIWQFTCLLFSPSKLYKQFQFSKQTKSKWARDDPAFLVILSLALCISSAVFAVVLRLSFFGFIKFILYVVFVDCVGVGLIIGTIFWALFRKFQPGSGVEWAYAFDVHLNAFTPLLIIAHGLLLCLYKLICQPYILSTLLGNTLWLLAISYYIYITFLGYSAVSPSKVTVFILYAVLPLVLFYLISIPLNLNLTVGLYTFYAKRVGHSSFVAY